MNQQELEALLAQIAPNNTPGRLEFNQSTETIEVDAPGASPYDPPVKKKAPVQVLTWVDRGTGQTLKVQANGDGTYTKLEQGRVPQNIGAAATTAAEAQAQQGKTARESVIVNGKALTKVTTEKTGPNGTEVEAYYVDPVSGERVQPPTTAPRTTDQEVGSRTVQTPDGKTVKVTRVRRPDGTIEEITDEAQVPAKPTDVRTDPQTGRRYETIRNPDGTVKEERELPAPTGPGSQTQYTYPELKMAYGNIASEVMSIARDIYGRVGTGPGKITKEEADRLFKPIYEQAQLRVQEINGIVTTQKSVWDSQQQTANSRLDASTRMAGQAFGLAKDANLMAPGTGKVAGQMVWDMMNAQRDFASSMGGLKDPTLPGYLQAAMDMGPNAPGGPPAAPSGPGGVPGAPAGPGGPPGALPPSGISNTTDAGGVPRVFTPASSSVGAGQPPGPPPALGQGQDLSTPPDPGRGTYTLPPPGAGPQGPVPQGLLPPRAPDTDMPGASTSSVSPGSGITINIGHPGGAPQQATVPMPQQQAYLQPATQQQRPSLQAHQKDMAGQLLAAGFDQDVIDQLWRQNTGAGLAG